jgi:SAM-dependent methyltransferase
VPGSTHDELERIRAAYEERDRRGGSARGGWDSPAYVVHMHELEWQLLKALREAQIDLSSSRVLDVGAGGGYLLNRLAEFGAREAVGVELVPERVEQARSHYPGIEMHCASASELPFEDDSFDVVTQFTCLSSVLDDAVRGAMANEMRRVTRRNGVIVSYDLRPSPRVLRVLRRRLGGPARDSATPTAALGFDALTRLFGQPERANAVQLNLDLAELVGGRRRLIAALRVIRPLRSHTLATFRVP